jgi:hypothetical protein
MFSTQMKMMAANKSNARPIQFGELSLMWPGWQMKVKDPSGDLAGGYYLSACAASGTGAARSSATPFLRFGSTVDGIGEGDEVPTHHFLTAGRP